MKESDVTSAAVLSGLSYWFQGVSSICFRRHLEPDLGCQDYYRRKRGIACRRKKKQNKMIGSSLQSIGTFFDDFDFPGLNGL